MVRDYDDKASLALLRFALAPRWLVVVVAAVMRFARALLFTVTLKANDGEGGRAAGRQGQLGDSNFPL